jgi:hypothetical protein
MAMRTYRTIASVSLVVALSACGSGQSTDETNNAATNTALTSCTSAFALVPSPNVGAGDNVLAAVAGSSNSDIWAVGQFVPDSKPTITSTLTTRFNGSTWSVVASPNVGGRSNALTGVAVKSGKAWAVGYYIDGSGVARSLIESWNGSTWSVVAHPQPGSADTLFKVSTVSATDIWAVGYQWDSAGVFHTLTEHFNGTAWSVVSSLDPGVNGNELYAVAAIASNNVWAVGQQVGSAFPDKALIEHWNGTKWSLVAAPASASSTQLLSLSAASSAVVWGVGDAQDDVHGQHTLAERAVNGAWGIQTSATIGSAENHLLGVSAASDSLAWAVGQYMDAAGGTMKTLIERGGSSGWVQVSSPNATDTDDNGLADVAVVDAHNVWAVGMFAGANADQTLIVHACP